MAQFRDALWHSESHALAAERSIDPLGVGSAPYEVRPCAGIFTGRVIRGRTFAGAHNLRSSLYEVRLSERTQLLVIHVVLTDGRPLILDMPVIGLVVDTSVPLFADRS